MSDLLTRDLDLYVAGSSTSCARLTADGGLICDDLSRLRCTMFADVVEPVDRTIVAGNLTADICLMPFPPSAVPKGLRDV